MAINNGELTYFIKCHEMVKIGKTTGLKARITQLQAGNPYELEIIGVTFHPEPNLHDKFAHLKNKNEWYYLTDELKEYIAKYAASPPSIAVAEVETDPTGEIYGIIKKIEKRWGIAAYDKIINMAGYCGFDKEETEAEITHLIRDARIFKPVRYANEYRVTQQ